MKKMFFVSLILLICVSMAQAALFTDTHSNSNLNRADGWGQTFTPAKATLDPAGIELPQTVYLQDWSYTYTDSTTNKGASGQTYLAVYSDLTVANMDSNTLVGLSSNFISFEDMAANQQMTWDFDNLALDKDTEYALMFVQHSQENQLMVIKGAVRLGVGNQYQTGGWIRINEVSNDWDADFTATYNTIPEPATMLLLGLGGLGLVRRRKA